MRPKSRRSCTGAHTLSPLRCCLFGGSSSSFSLLDLGLFLGDLSVFKGAGLACGDTLRPAKGTSVILGGIFVVSGGTIHLPSWCSPYCCRHSSDSGVSVSRSRRSCAVRYTGTPCSRRSSNRLKLRSMTILPSSSLAAAMACRHVRAPIAACRLLYCTGGRVMVAVGGRETVAVGTALLVFLLQSRPHLLAAGGLGDSSLLVVVLEGGPAVTDPRLVWSLLDCRPVWRSWLEPAIADSASCSAGKFWCWLGPVITDPGLCWSLPRRMRSRKSPIKVAALVS